MSKEGKIRKIIVVGSVISGVVAAYLMYRRGTPLFTIARKTIANPVGALVGELRGAQ
jgi:predicted NAD/FAD-binding protein